MRRIVRSSLAARQTTVRWLCAAAAPSTVAAESLVEVRCVRCALPALKTRLRAHESLRLRASRSAVCPPPPSSSRTFCLLLARALLSVQCVVEHAVSDVDSESFAVVELAGSQYKVASVRVVCALSPLDRRHRPPASLLVVCAHEESLSSPPSPHLARMTF